jgi:hypothetical protein
VIGPIANTTSYAITATYNGYTAQANVTVNGVPPANFNFFTISELQGNATLVIRGFTVGAWQGHSITYRAYNIIAEIAFRSGGGTADDGGSKLY